MTKGQVSIMIILGVVLIITFTYLSYTAKPDSSRSDVQLIQEKSTSEELLTLQEHIKSCLDLYSRESLVLAGKQGGYIYASQGGITPDPDPMLRGEEYLEISGSRIPYAVRRSTGTIYTEPPMYPYYGFPEFFFAGDLVEPFYLTRGPYGVNVLITYEEIKHQLEPYIKAKTDSCIRWDEFRNRGLDITHGESKVEVQGTFFSTIINMTLQVHVVVNSSGAQGDLDSFVHEYGIRLRAILNFTAKILNKEITDIEFNISEKQIENLTFIRAQDIPQKDEAFIANDSESHLLGEQYNFYFGIQNRHPGLFFLNDTNHRQLNQFEICGNKRRGAYNGPVFNMTSDSLRIQNPDKCKTRLACVSLTADDPDDQASDYHFSIEAPMDTGSIQGERIISEEEIQRYTDTHNKKNLTLRVRASDGVLSDTQDIDFQVAYNSNKSAPITTPTQIGAYGGLQSSAFPGATSLVVDTADGFSPGDEIMIHQTYSNPPSDLGKYVINYIQDVNGETVNLLYPLETAFLSDSANRAQIIKVVRYIDLDIMPGGALNAKPWDGTKGGVLAIDVDGFLTLNQNSLISADGIGYPGGAAVYCNYCPGCGGNTGGGPGGGGWGAFPAHPVKGCCDKEPYLACYMGKYAGGGGGGYGTPGVMGQGTIGATRGNGANPIFPYGGPTYGANTDIFGNQLMLGSGGGSMTGKGGNGGGAIYVRADSIIDNGGKIQSRGEDGGQADFGGGGGSGGSIIVQTKDDSCSPIYPNFDISGGIGGNLAGAGGIGRAQCIGWNTLIPERNCTNACRCAQCYTNRLCHLVTSEQVVHNPDIIPDKNISCTRNNFTANSIVYNHNPPANWNYPIGTITLRCKSTKGRGSMIETNGDIKPNETQEMPCPCDQAMVGIKYADRQIASVGDWMSEIEPICQGFTLDSLDPEKIFIPEDMIGTNHVVKCPERQVVTAIHYQKKAYSFGEALDGVTVGCSELVCPTPVPENTVAID